MWNRFCWHIALLECTKCSRRVSRYRHRNRETLSYNCWINSFLSIFYHLEKHRVCVLWHTMSIEQIVQRGRRQMTIRDNIVYFYLLLLFGLSWVEFRRWLAVPLPTIWKLVKCISNIKQRPISQVCIQFEIVHMTFDRFVINSVRRSEFPIKCQFRCTSTTIPRNAHTFHMNSWAHVKCGWTPNGRPFQPQIPISHR